MEIGQMDHAPMILYFIIGNLCHLRKYIGICGKCPLDNIYAFNHIKMNRFNSTLLIKCEF